MICLGVLATGISGLYALHSSSAEGNFSFGDARWDLVKALAISVLVTLAIFYTLGCMLIFVPFVVRLCWPELEIADLAFICLKAFALSVVIGTTGVILFFVAANLVYSLKW